MNEEHKHISKRVGTVGFYTFISRIFGLVRDSALAWAFGATAMADAFYVAFRIPNLLRRFVAEGALTIAFVPVFSDFLRRSRQDAREALSVTFTYLSMFLVLLSILGVLFSPYIVRLIAWGFSGDPTKFELTVFLTRVMFPYIFLISLVALAMGVLNSLKRFAAPAAAPVLLNVSIILSAVFLSKFTNPPVLAIALGVVFGGVLQLLLQIPSLSKENMLPRLNFNWRHSALKGLLLLMIPSAIGATVYQLNVLVVTLLASFLPEGSVSYLWYADRVSEFSLGIFSISVATVALPTMSQHAAANDMRSFKDTINYSLRLAMLTDIPSAIGLYVLSGLIVTVLFKRGEFDAGTAAATAAALSVFALKIPFVSGVRNLVPAFFSLKDAKTPVAVSAVAVVINAVAALLLMHKFKHVGLAGALVISGVANYVILFVLLRRRVGPLGGRKIALSGIKTLIASVVMGAVVLLLSKWLGIHDGGAFSLKLALLAGLVVAGVFTYVAIIRLISPEEFLSLMSMVRRRVKKKVA